MVTALVYSGANFDALNLPRVNSFTVSILTDYDGDYSRFPALIVLNFAGGLSNGGKPRSAYYRFFENLLQLAIQKGRSIYEIDRPFGIY
jgi:hypothetical protein